ncbi:MAG TPA: DUF167 domain-containing protein [Tepidisphaeraceae bacterium]|jgi:uncharacterized protein YggU (UPF0235/DUF167 family)
MVEWILIIELILLGAAALFAIVARFVVGGDRSDPIYIWCSTFWRNFLYPPEVMEIDSWSFKRGAAPGRLKNAGAASFTNRTDDDAYGRVKKDRDGRMVSANLELLVVANSPSDEVVGVEDGGLRIHVTGEAGDGRTNKALIEMVASALGLKPYQCTITKGHYHPRKTVQIQGLRSDELDAKLASIS